MDAFGSWQTHSFFEFLANPPLERQVHFIRPCAPCGKHFSFVGQSFNAGVHLSTVEGNRGYWLEGFSRSGVRIYLLVYWIIVNNPILTVYEGNTVEYWPMSKSIVPSLLDRGQYLRYCPINQLVYGLLPEFLLFTALKNLIHF